jgi:hypothetical protein
MTDTPTLADLEKSLVTTTERYRSAENRAATARREETDALNSMNAAQKALDARLAEMRKTAPRGSDWNSCRGISA